MMKKACRFVFVVFLPLKTSALEAQAGLPSPIPSFTRKLSERFTITPTLTLTPLPVWPPATSTETQRPDVAQTLPHTDLYLMYHGDRTKRYVALNFDLCQKPELPAWFDQGIYD